MNIALFDELESKIKLLAEELRAARQGLPTSVSHSENNSKLKAIESRIEHLIQLLDEYEGNSNG